MLKQKISNMNLKTLRRLTILSALIFFSLAGAAGAWYKSDGYSFDVIGYNPFGAAEYVAGEAEEYWNDSGANTHIGAAPQSGNPIYWNDYDYNWFGQYRPGVGKFSIWLNQRSLYEEYGNNYWDRGINTAVHEFGHALHLAHPDDHEVAGNTTIMSYERIRSQHAPRPLDVSNLIKYRGQYQ